MQEATHAQVLAFVWHYCRRRILIIIAMVSVLLLGTAVVLIKPFFLKEAVDLIIENETRDAAVMKTAMLFVAFGALLGFAHFTLQQIGTVMLSWLDSRVMREAHNDVFAHMQRLSTQFHADTFAGSTIRKVNRGTDAIEDILDKMWFNFFPLVAVSIGLVVVLLFYVPIMGAAMAVMIVLYTIAAVWLNLILAKYHRWVDRQDTRLTGSLADAVTGNATVKAFAAERSEEARHDTVVAEWQSRLWKTWRTGNLFTWILFMLMGLIEFVLLLIGVWLWYRGEFTAGGFIIVVAYVGRLWGSMHDIGQNVRNYLSSVAHAQEMVGLYRTPLGIADVPNARNFHVMKGAIAFRNVDFAYEANGKPIFRNFSVDIESGEKIALVGHSGGGKSTFVKLLLRLYDIQGGSISIDGQNIAEVTQESLRKAIGLMPQDPLLFHRTIAENIGYGKPSASDTEIERVAKLAHAHEFIKDFPKGYDTLVGERGVKLSGGERQRTAIARAILADTPILILDEATSSLDSLSEKYIQESLEYLMQGRTTIVIAHRLSTIKKADRILVIERGAIVEEGSHGALVRKKDGVYRKFYELQAGGFIGE